MPRDPDFTVAIVDPASGDADQTVEVINSHVVFGDPNDGDTLIWNAAEQRFEYGPGGGGSGLSEPVTFTQDVTFQESALFTWAAPTTPRIVLNGPADYSDYAVVIDAGDGGALKIWEDGFTEHYVSAAGGGAAIIAVTGDSANRTEFRAGSIRFGSGAAAANVELGYLADNVLYTNDAFAIRGGQALRLYANDNSEFASIVLQQFGANRYVNNNYPWIITAADGVTWSDGAAAPDLGLRRLSAARARLTDGVGGGFGDLDLGRLNVLTSIQDANEATRNIRWVTGTPEGAVAAAVSSLAFRTDGSRGRSIYVKDSGAGNTGWHPLGAQQIIEERHATTTIANDATERTLYTQNIVAADMPTGAVFRLVAIGDYLNNDGGVRTLSLRFKFGATTFAASLNVNHANLADRKSWRCVVDIHIAGANEQRCWAQANFTNAAAAGTMAVSISGYPTAAYRTITEDVSSAKDLVVTAQHSAASANLDIRLHSAVLERIF